MAIRKIISGGQTGADQGGLAAGVELRLLTGGWAPRGWRTQDGSAPWLEKFGVQEHPSAEYPPRTRQNVFESDGTLWVGNPDSPGGRLTLRTCREAGKPKFEVRLALPLSETAVTDFRAWVDRFNIRVLNVAGNRESSSPGIGIGVFTRDFLVRALAARRCEDGASAPSGE
jgi:hypothetical protein